MTDVQFIQVMKDDLKTIDAVKKPLHEQVISLYDGKTEYKVGEWDEMETDKEADNVAVKGMHIASFDFAKRYAGNRSCKIAILEVKVNIHDVIIPNAEDQVRCSRWMITREVPREEFAQLERTQRQAVA